MYIRLSNYNIPLCACACACANRAVSYTHLLCGEEPDLNAEVGLRLNSVCRSHAWFLLVSNLYGLFFGTFWYILLPGVPARNEDKISIYRVAGFTVKGVALLRADVRFSASSRVHVHQEAARSVIVDRAAPAIPATVEDGQPVSYTHLDVYKRQAHRCRIPWAFRWPAPFQCTAGSPRSARWRCPRC